MVQIKARVIVDTRKLKLVPKLVELGIINGLKKGAGEIERRAKSYSPVEKGDLRRSIGIDNTKKGAGTISISVSPKMPYAGRMEQPGNVRKRGRRPYMRPALLDSTSKIINHLKNESRRAIG